VGPQLPPYPEIPTLSEALAWIEANKKPESEPAGWLSLPLREVQELPSEQFLGEIHDDGDDRLINMTLAQNGSAIFFYEIERQQEPLRNIRVGPIYCVKMADILREGARLVKRKER